MTNLSNSAKGACAILAAAMIWGLQPIFYGFLIDIPASQIAAHRIIWSFVFLFTFLLLRGRIKDLIAAVTEPRQASWTLLAAVLVSFNWFFFVYAIQLNRLTESSLGYYIYPLVSVALGYVLFRERFPALQWCAVGLATLGVLVLTIGLGSTPTISLILASTFALYGVVKKRVRATPMVSVTAEVLLLSPLVLGWLIVSSSLTDHSIGTWALFFLSGPLTGIPLILFAYASQHLRLSTVGLVSYLNPTIQLIVAVMFFSEPFTPWHGVALGLIWAALALYSVVAIHQDRVRAASNPAMSGTIR